MESNQIDKRKHILVVSQYFFPEQFRVNDICLEWINRGYKVTVLTGIPNYPKGEFYSGYGFFKKRKEIWNGINIIRIPILARGNKSIQLVLNYVSFVISGFFWKLFTRIQADLVFIYEQSPIFQAYPGLWYAKKNNIPVYLYVMDLWPDNIKVVANVKNRALLNTISSMVNSIYSRSNTILTSSNAFRTEIIKRGQPSNKVYFWPQYAEEFYTVTSINDIGKNSIDSNRFNIIFTGNIGRAQGLLVLVDCIEYLETSDSRICFNLVGEGRFLNELVELIEIKGYQSYFNFIGQIPAINIPGVIAACDCTFISLDANPLFDLTIPAKLQSYMACGKPVLGSINGEVQDIIRSANCGYVADAGDAISLAKNIKSLLNRSDMEKKEMGENALIYFNNHFRKKLLMDKMDEFLNWRNLHKQ